MISFDTEKKPRELVPAGGHIATLYSIIELGTMVGEYMGKPTQKKKIRLTWELPEETREFDGVQKPMVVGKTYTASLFEMAKLRPIVAGMLGGLTEEQEENFDIKSLLGKACMLQIAHEEYNGNKYASVVSCTQLPKSVAKPTQFNDSQYLDYGDGWDSGVYEKLPQFVKDKMSESLEMKERATKTDDFSYPENNLGDSPF